MRMDRLYVIYKEGEMVKNISNGYNTKRGTKAVITQMAKKDLKKEGICIDNVATASEKEMIYLNNAKKVYEIKEFMNPKELSIWEYIKRKVT